jgi:hypothetical protein
MEHRDDQELGTENIAEPREQAPEAPAEPETPAAARSHPPTATATAEPAESTTGEPPVETPGDTRPDTVEPVTEDRVAVVLAESRERYGARWNDVQTGFVDEPRQSVQQADQLVTEVIEYLTQSFLDERGRLEEQWSRGDVDTERLRLALQGYRMLFSGLVKG